MRLAIIGGGPAGYTAAEIAGRAGVSVTLFEQHALGGVCLNEGCIPTKTLLQSAKTYDHAKEAKKYAVNVGGPITPDLPRITLRKQKVVRKLVLGIKAKLQAAGVTVVTGRAVIVDAHHVACAGATYECDRLLLCTGSETFIPPIAGLDAVPYWTHREALEAKTLPDSLTIIGGGVIGMEFASFFCSLGTKVTVIEMMPEILGGLDAEISALLRAEYAKRGVRFLTGTNATGVALCPSAGEPDGGPATPHPAEATRAGLAAASVARHEGGSGASGSGGPCAGEANASEPCIGGPSAGKLGAVGPGIDKPCSGGPSSRRILVTYADAAGHEGEVVADRLLVCVGRRPVLSGYGLEGLGLECDGRGRPVVDAQMRTSVPTVFACGDLTGRSMLAHTAVRQAEVAVHTLLGQADAMCYDAIPGVVYTSPEVASVGQTEEQLQRAGTPYRAIRLPMTYSGRFVAENEGQTGLCKLLFAPDTTLLGAHLLGNPASEIIALAGMAIDLRLTAAQWGRTILPHPSVSEIFREALTQICR